MRPFIVPALALLFATSACLDTIRPLTPEIPECVPFDVVPVTERGDTVLTSTGLEFIDLHLGEGVKATSCMLVIANVEGSLLGGTVFFSTRDLEPWAFVLGTREVPAGIEQGVVGMNAGGVRRLIVPPALAFGPEDLIDQAGNVVVPGGSTVIFDIELIQVTPEPQ